MSPPHRYAEGTSVPIHRSRREIDALLRAWGCRALQWTDDWEAGRVVLAFEWRRKDEEVYTARFAMELEALEVLTERARHATTRVVLPGKLERLTAAAGRQEHRALLLWLRAAFAAIVAHGVQMAHGAVYQNRDFWKARPARGGRTSPTDCQDERVESGVLPAVCHTGEGGRPLRDHRGGGRVPAVDGRKGWADRGGDPPPTIARHRWLRRASTPPRGNGRGRDNPRGGPMTARQHDEGARPMPAETWPKLCPCPFCGEPLEPKEPAYSYVARGSKWGAVECRDCGATGPEVRTGYEIPAVWAPAAAEQWNQWKRRPELDPELLGHRALASLRQLYDVFRAPRPSADLRAAMDSAAAVLGEEARPSPSRPAIVPSKVRTSLGFPEEGPK